MSIIQLGRISFFCIFLALFSVTEANSQCSITDLAITNSVCDENDNYTVEINFNFEGTGDNGFQVLGNGNNYGTFQYADLPITLEELTGNCELELEFIVRDVFDPTCAAFQDYGPVCCDDICSLTIQDFEVSDCNDDAFFNINLDLDFEFEGDNGYSVVINNEDIGNFSYEDLPLNLEGLNSTQNGLNLITICDLDFLDCCVEMTFSNPCVCAMTNITSNVIDCNSTDSTYFVVIDFDHTATNDSFQMGYPNGGTNVFLGTFAYNDLPVTAGPIFLSDNEQEILIVDTDDFFCFSSAYMGTIEDCTIECLLFNVFAEAYMCEDGEYFMDVEFEAKDIVGSTFDILVDGINYGTFDYGENFYTVGPIPSNCDDAPTVVVQDNGVDTCSDFFNLSDPVCCLPDCNFTSFEASAECGTTTLTINGSFENNGQMLDGLYFVEFLGTSYGPFSYDDFLFSIEVPLLANGVYEISINDGSDPECQISTSIMSQCDEELCMIFDVFAEPSECENNTFFADIEFEFGGEVSDSFEITGNGNNYGTFAYGETFYSVGPLEGDCETIYEFVVSDLINDACSGSTVFEEAICCPIGNCIISDLEIIDFECFDEMNIESFILNFNYSNNPSGQFRASIDGLDVGIYDYIDLPVTINVSTSSSFELIINDSEDSECESTQEFNLDCLEDDCFISDLALDFIECTDDNSAYFISIDFNHVNSSDSFNIVVNDNLFGPYNYDQLPLDFGPLSIGEEHFFQIGDLNNTNCFEEVIIFIEQCDTGLEEAEFSNLEITQNFNFISVKNNESEPLMVKLFSTSGALLKNAQVDINLMHTFDTSNIPQGLYLLNISNSSKQKTVKLIVF